MAQGCGTKEDAPSEKVLESKAKLYFEQRFPTYSGLAAKNIGIVGGGTAGLYTAWLLRGLGHNVTIFEKKGRVGGNVFTAYLNFNQDTTSSNLCSTPGPTCIQRWADLGVNDFNTKTYFNFTAMLDILKVRHWNLQDSSYFGRLNGEYFRPDTSAFSYVCSEKLWKGVDTCEDVQFGMFGRRGAANFFSEGVELVLDPQFYDYTIDDYTGTSRTASRNYDQEFVTRSLKARVNNMFFTNEADPGGIRARLILSYYGLQEGLTGGTVSPDRRYFTDGASEWIRALYTSLLSPSPAYPTGFAPTPGAVANFELCATVDYIKVDTTAKTVHWNASNPSDPTVEACNRTGSGAYTNFDYVIMAANSAGAQAILTNTASTGVPTALSNAYGALHPTQSHSYVHTYNNELFDPSTMTPANANDNLAALRTYNIYDYANTTSGSPRPYTITYVENRHQNDPQNPLYGYPTVPFYLTVGNPLPGVSPTPRPIPSSDPTCNATIGCKALMQFPSTLRPPGADSTRFPYVIPTWWDGQPTEAVVFHHTKADDQYIEAQRQVQGYIDPGPTYYAGNQGINGLYLVGSVTLGAQLQEEIMVQAREVANQIENAPTYQNNQRWNRGGGPGRYPPLYLQTLMIPAGQFSGGYYGPDEGFGYSQPCLKSYQMNVKAGNTYQVSTCNAYTGDTVLKLTAPGCSVTNDDYCGLGSQATCTPTDDGVMTICASVYSSTYDTNTTWNYQVSYPGSVSSGTPGTCYSPFSFDAEAGQQFQISTCGSYSGPVSLSVSGVCSCTGTCSCTCKATDTGPVNVCPSVTTSGTPASWNYSTTIYDPLNNNTYNGQAGTTGDQVMTYALPLGGGGGGGTCGPASSLACPAGYVATGFQYDNVNYYGWPSLSHPRLICRQVINQTTLGSTSVLTPALCGGYSGSTVSYECPSPTQTVLNGEQIYWNGGYAQSIVGYCYNLVNRGTSTIGAAAGSLAADAHCPIENAVTSLQVHAGDIADAVGMTCTQPVPVGTVDSCLGHCGAMSGTCSCGPECNVPSPPSTCCKDFTSMCIPDDSCLGHCGSNAPAGCWCDTYCRTYGDCCDDALLMCPATGGITWTVVSGGLVDIGATNGEVWGTNSASNIYQYTGTNAWTQISGGLTRIAVDTLPGFAWGTSQSGNNGTTWGVNQSDGSLWQRNPVNSAWTRRDSGGIAGAAADVGAGGGQIWVVKNDGSIWQLNYQGVWVQPTPGAWAMAIDADDAGNPWHVGSGTNVWEGVLTSTGLSWVAHGAPSGQTDIDIGLGGSGLTREAWVTTNGGDAFYWNGSSWVSGGFAGATGRMSNRVAVDVYGVIWITATDGTIWRGKRL